MEDVETLLKRIAGGERNALSQLYEREAPKLLGVAMRLVKRRSVAEEIVHDAFLKIWDNAGRYETGNARGWIITIVRNRALNVLRGEARIDLTDDFSSFERESEEESPEDRLGRLSDESALKRCLDLLDATRRKIIVLAYTEGLSHGEIAGKLGVPLGTIKSWIRRSLLSLKECMG